MNARATLVTIGTIFLGGVSALGCGAPSSVNGGAPAGSVAPTPLSSSASTMFVAPTTGQALRVDWPAPAVGHTYSLMPTPSTVAWGWYDAAGKPVLTMNSGDEVVVRALSTCSPTSLVRAGLDSSRVEQLARDIYAARSTIKPGPGGHILTGPIYVEGADSGDVLEVRFKSIKPAIDYACNSFGPRSGFLPEDFPGESHSKIIELDTVNMIGHFANGINIPLHPFFGSVGDAPPASMGRINSAPPGIHAGNLDNKELVAGTTLYIPVWTRGALLEIGDGHAGQGNGEVDITAMETSLIGRLQLVVRKDMHLSWPRAETPTHYIAMGIDKDLEQATKLAVRQAIELLVQVKGMSREDAYQLVSVSSDVDVTQLVDGTVGVHVMIPKAIFTRQNR
ncbi:MAG TPA: acetamidase/formamidase family protein [Gemmatimonadaceae bacterium]|nr:acetamidase/formamidase family protein [Gemmatimonadaceae bacterium]